MLIGLFGDENRPPLQLNSSVDVKIYLRKAHRLYWDEKLNTQNQVWGICFQKDWAYNDISLYSDYFINLRIAELTNLSLVEFLNLDYYFAIEIIDKAVKKAEKELEEERKRKEEEERKRSSAEMKQRLNRRK